MKNKSIFITGAASGIGRSTAILFAKKGYHLYLSDINMTALNDLNKYLVTLGVEANCFEQDVSIKDSFTSIVKSIETAESGLDILCNCAGIGMAKPFEDIKIEEWETIFSINFYGVLYSCQSFLPLLKKNSGQIINVASTAGIMGLPGMSPYCASKHAVVGLSESLAIEYYSEKVAVKTINPGFVNTNIINNNISMSFGLLDQELAKKFYSKFGASPDHVAHSIYKLSRSWRYHKLTSILPLIPALIIRKTSKTLYIKMMGVISKYFANKSKD
jgi:short-subunit dehydrogenase